MSKSRPPYPAAFRQQMVELVRSGRTPGDLAREFRTVGPGHPDLGRSDRPRHQRNEMTIPIGLRE